MATYVLIPGAGSDSWYWHLVEPQLRALGHDVVAVDLPCDNVTAGFDEYVEVALDAIGERTDLILVAQSMGGFTAALVAERRPVDLMVLVAAMVPRPGESGGEWWANTGHAEAKRAQDLLDGRDPDAEFDPVELFLHDVAPDTAAASADHVHDQSSTPFEQPYPLQRWPDVPTRFLLGRNDRLFPAEFQRRVVRDRLGIEPDEIDSGHLPALAQPDALVRRLESYRNELP